MFAQLRLPLRVQTGNVDADAAPSTRYLLMTGQPYGEEPVFNGPFVD